MLTAVFIVGKLGKIENEYRHVLVEKVPGTDYDENVPQFDSIKVKMWNPTSKLLHKIKDDTMVSIKGRLEENNGELVVIAELFRSAE